MDSRKQILEILKVYLDSETVFRDSDIQIYKQFLKTLFFCCRNSFDLIPTPNEDPNLMPKLEEHCKPNQELILEIVEILSLLLIPSSENLSETETNISMEGNLIVALRDELWKSILNSVSAKTKVEMKDQQIIHEYVKQNYLSNKSEIHNRKIKTSEGSENSKNNDHCEHLKSRTSSYFRSKLKIKVAIDSTVEFINTSKIIPDSIFNFKPEESSQRQSSRGRSEMTASPKKDSEQFSSKINPSKDSNDSKEINIDRIYEEKKAREENSFLDSELDAKFQQEAEQNLESFLKD